MNSLVFFLTWVKFTLVYFPLELIQMRYHCIYLTKSPKRDITNPSQQINDPTEGDKKVLKRVLFEWAN